MLSSKTAHPTRSSRPTRTARRLLKVVSLGVAGLIAGLLGGCNASDQTETTLTAGRIENLEAKRIPALRHAPLPHYTQQNTHQAIANRGGRAMKAQYTASRYTAASTGISGQ